MSGNWKSAVRRYVLAIGILTLILGVQNLLLLFSIKLSFTIPIIVGLVAAGWYGGRGPGIFLAALMALISAVSNQPAPGTTRGEWLFSQISNFALMVFIVLVITERRSVTRREYEASERYRRLFQDNPFPMWIYDVETLGFISVNEAACHQYGYSSDEFLTMKITEIRPEEEVASLLENIDKATGLLQKSGDWRHRRRDGSDLFVEITSHEIDFLDRRARLVLANDVTARHQAEENVRHLNETLERRVAERTVELELVNKELESFAYSVSHDLRAPLRAMDGFSLALIEDYSEKLDDTGKNFLSRVRTASQQMSRLIDDLLSLSRVTRSELRHTQVDLSSIANEIIARYSELHPRESFISDVQNNVKVFGDERLLRIALENLLGNAWKFTSKTENPRISFKVAKNNGHSTYCISDNGAGFDMKYADKLFGAFQRLHSTKEFEGTGIGLATVQRIINRHGGRIWAESEVGKGAAFYFTI